MLRPIAPSTSKLYSGVMLRAFGNIGSGVPDDIPERVSTWTESNKAILRAALKRRYLEQGLSEEDANEIVDTIPVTWHAQKVTEIPSEEEAKQYEAVCAQLPPGKRAMALLPLAMGLRSKEVLSLPRRSVERAAQHGELIVLRKGGKEQVLDTAHAKGLFAELLTVRAAKLTNLFEPSTEGKAWKTAGEIISTGNAEAQYQAFHRLVKATGLKAGIEGMRPHKLRHMWATRMVRDGAPLAVVQWGLGHASITTTQKYVHAQSSDVAKYMRKFE